MSASTYDRRERARRHRARGMARDAAGPRDSAERRSWVGVDLARFGGPPRSRTVLPLVALALVAALGVAALRIDLIRTRYALAARLSEEQAQIERQRALIVELRARRDPALLAGLARDRGYRPAERVIALSDPLPGPRVATDPGAHALTTSGLAQTENAAWGSESREAQALPPVGAPPPGGSGLARRGAR